LVCWLLRTIILRCHHAASDAQSSSAQRQQHNYMLIVRMEAIYIGWTLTGICIGWIVLDIWHDMTSQIYISIALFILSLTSFGCILYFFPESDCDNDPKNQKNNTCTNNNSLQEPLLRNSNNDEEEMDEPTTYTVNVLVV
jgi:hypothetical protein